MDNQEELSKKIEDLPFTEDLKNILKARNLLTLQDILDLPVSQWHKTIPGFTYHHQHEVISHLTKNNLAELLKEE